MALQLIPSLFVVFVPSIPESKSKFASLLTDGKKPVKTLNTLGRFTTNYVVDFLMDDKTDAESISSVAVMSSYSVCTESESSDEMLSTPRPTKSRGAKSSEKSDALLQTSRRSDLTKVALSSCASKPSPVQAPTGASKQGSTGKTAIRRKSTVISSKSLMMTEEAGESGGGNSRKAGGTSLKRSDPDIKKMGPRIVVRRMSANGCTALQQKSQAVPPAEKPARRRLKEQFEEASVPRGDGRRPRPCVRKNTR